MPGPSTSEAGRARGRLTKALALVPVAAASVCATHYTAHMTSPITKSLGQVLHVAAKVPLDATPPTVTTPHPVPTPAPTTAKPARVKPRIDVSLTPFGVPTVAVAAFQNAATVIDGVDPGCRLSWQFLAAIGREESGDGLGQGNVLTAAGVDEPGIYGPMLDGKGGVAAIPDSDGGRLDGSTTWDRAVGPMQFLPATWAVVGVDADGDGVANPQDINDAALSAAVYLCSYGADLGTPAGERAGAYRYNHSHSYVTAVMAILRQYLDGGYTTVSTAAEKSAKRKTTASAGSSHSAASAGSSAPTSSGTSGTAAGGAPSSSAPTSSAPSSAPSSQPTTSTSPGSTSTGSASTGSASTGSASTGSASTAPSASASPTASASASGSSSASGAASTSGSTVSPSTSTSQAAAVQQCLATTTLGADVTQAVPGAATMTYADLLSAVTGVDTVLAGEFAACVTSLQG